MDALTALSPLFVATFRDWVIIVSGIAIAGFFLAALVVTLVLGLLTRVLLKKVSALLDDRLGPLLDTAKQSAEDVRGTTKYMSQAAVTPIVRTYGVIAGVRRAASVLTGLAGASTDNDGKKH